MEKGAKVHLQVKYGLITLINQDADLCDQGEKVNLECPLKKGELILAKDIDLPREIPPVSSPICIPFAFRERRKLARTIIRFL